MQFSLYHTVTISATPGSSKITASTKINGNPQELDFSQNVGSIVVRNNNDLTLTVWENNNALNNGLHTEFAGALVIGPNGSTFYPVGAPENMWKKVEEEDEFGQKHYGFTLHVSFPVSIRLIFVQSPAVTYFANGGTYEAESGNTSGVVSFKGFHLRLWDYSKLWGNIQGIICPLFTFFWGVLSLAYYFLLYPRLRKLVEWFVAHPLASFMVGVCFGIFLIDLCFSIHLGAVVQKKAAEIDKNVYDAIDVQKLWHKMQSRGGFFRLVSIRPLTERIDAFDEFLHRRPGNMEQK